MLSEPWVETQAGKVGVWEHLHMSQGIGPRVRCEIPPCLETERSTQNSGPKSQNERMPFVEKHPLIFPSCLISAQTHLGKLLAARCPCLNMDGSPLAVPMVTLESVSGQALHYEPRDLENICPCSVSCLFILNMCHLYRSLCGQNDSGKCYPGTQQK